MSQVEEAVVAWGAAALSDGTRLRHSYTRVSIAADYLTRLRDERHLHAFPAAIELEDENDAGEELVVLMVRHGAEHEALFRPELGGLGGVVTHAHRGRWRYYVFAGLEAFRQYAQQSAVAVLDKVLYEPASDASKDLVRTGLTLLPNHPELNAVRAYLDARASVRSAEGFALFELFLAALRGENADYELKYEDGAAAGGGFDVDIAADTLRAIESANASFAHQRERRYPYLREIPPPRLHELRAASAEFHFVPSIAGRPMGERVARYLALHFISEVLRGDRQPDVASSRELAAAVRIIVQPSPDTRLQQKRLSENEREDVIQPAALESESSISPELTVLGIISGLQRDSRAELWIGPERRFYVATSSDDKGDVPGGAEAIRGDGRFLRRPSIFTLARESSEGGAERFHLRQMQVMQVGDQRQITSIPSGVLEGAFVVGLALDVAHNQNGTLVTPLGSFEGVSAATLPVARRWLEEFRAACNQLELLTPVADLTWPAPVRKQEPSALVRVLVILRQLNGVALVTDVVAGINERFKTLVRVNNTRRE